MVCWCAEKTLAYAAAAIAVSGCQVGGNCNFMVAAARLGLATASVGHIGTDIYGNFMDEVLRVSAGAGVVKPGAG